MHYLIFSHIVTFYERFTILLEDHGVYGVTAFSLQKVKFKEFYRQSKFPKKSFTFFLRGTLITPINRVTCLQINFHVTFCSTAILFTIITILTDSGYGITKDP